MKASELRIGNYIDSYYGIVCVEILGDLPYPCDIYTSPNKIQVRRNGGYSGIELTEEWLLRFGFEIDERRPNKHIYVTEASGKYFGVVKRIESDYFTISFYTYYDDVNFDNFKYVHQLQNLFFALTGEELELNK